MITVRQNRKTGRCEQGDTETVIDCKSWVTNDETGRIERATMQFQHKQYHMFLTLKRDEFLEFAADVLDMAARITRHEK